MSVREVRNAGGGRTQLVEVDGTTVADVAALRLGGEPGIVVGLVDRLDPSRGRSSAMFTPEAATDLRDALSLALVALRAPARCPAILEDHDARCEREPRHDGQHRQAIPGTLNAWHVWGSR